MNLVLNFIKVRHFRDNVWKKKIYLLHSKWVMSTFLQETSIKTGLFIYFYSKVRLYKKRKGYCFYSCNTYVNNQANFRKHNYFKTSYHNKESFTTLPKHLTNEQLINVHNFKIKFKLYDICTYKTYMHSNRCYSSLAIPHSLFIFFK